MEQSNWLDAQDTSRSLPVLSLTSQTSDSDGNWTAANTSRSLRDIAPALVPPGSNGATSAVETSSKDMLSGKMNQTGQFVSRLSSLSVPAQTSKTEFPAKTARAWQSASQGPPSMRKAVPLSLSSAHLFGKPASIMPACTSILKKAGITVTEHIDSWSLLGFHFDGNEAVEFEVLLSVYGPGSQHHVLELNKCVGSSASSSGGLILGKLLQLLVSQLRAQGFRVQRHSDQSSSGLSSLLSVPAEGTSAALNAYSASTGLDLAQSDSAARPPSAPHSGSDMLSSLSKPGMDASMLQDWSARAARLPRWRSTEDGVSPAPRDRGTFQQRRTEAALTPIADDSGSDASSSPSAPRGYMFRAMRAMRSQDSIPCSAPATAAGGDTAEQSDASERSGIRRSVSASAAPLPSAAGQGADAPGLWAPIRSMLVHGPATQREEAVRVLASLSANPTTHASIVRAKLPTLLARMLGLHSASQHASSEQTTEKNTEHGGDDATEDDAEVANGADKPSPQHDGNGALSELPNRLSRVGRALTLAMVENLSKSAVGLECMKQNGMLAALHKLLRHTDAQSGTFDLQPGAEILFSDAESKSAVAGTEDWVALSLSPAQDGVGEARAAAVPSRGPAPEGGTEPPCPDTASATQASRLGSVLARTRSTLSSISQEAVSNANLLKRHATAARDLLFSAFAASKLRGVAAHAEGGANADSSSETDTTALPHVPAQDEKTASSTPSRALRWATVSAAAPLPAAPVRAPLRHEASVGSVGSDGGVDARAAAIEAELATLPRAPAEPVVGGQAGATPSPSARRRGSATSDRSPAAVLA